MNESAQLLCEIAEELGEEKVKIRTWLQDGERVELAVSKYDVLPIEGTKRGWLNVRYSGEQNGVASITLPAPILLQGTRINVQTGNLQMPT